MPRSSSATTSKDTAFAIPSAPKNSPNNFLLAANSLIHTSSRSAAGKKLVPSRNSPLPPAFSATSGRLTVCTATVTAPTYASTLVASVDFLAMVSQGDTTCLIT